jgi:hypothetical protein
MAHLGPSTTQSSRDKARRAGRLPAWVLKSAKMRAPTTMTPLFTQLQSFSFSGQQASSGNGNSSPAISPGGGRLAEIDGQAREVASDTSCSSAAVTDLVSAPGPPPATLLLKAHPALRPCSGHVSALSEGREKLVYREHHHNEGCPFPCPSGRSHLKRPHA